MSYLELNKRQSTGETIKEISFIFEGKEAYIKLIKLDKPYADGTSYAVIENTSNAFCSNGLFAYENQGLSKYYLMLKNCNLIKEDQYKKLTKNLCFFKKSA